MATYVKFQLEDGTIIYIESTDIPKGSSGLIPSGRDHVEQATTSFDKSVESIRKMSTTLVDNLRSGFTEQPEEVAISFGIKASADLSNLVISRGGGEANFNVSLRWRHKDEEAASDSKEKEEKEKEEKEKEQGL
jgi:hypothetical protein